MKKIQGRRRAADEVRPEYQFDYAQARSNRFASQAQGNVVTVVLEPDVAQVFETSESVNRLLRSVILAVPQRRTRLRGRKPRRKVR
jgi:hypothetical protein